jgi:xanthine dehydrogenase accessory factor
VDETFYRRLADMLSRGPLVVATVIRTQGSVPRQAGAKLAVGSDGTLLGTVGGGAAEAEVIARAQTLLQTAVPVGDGGGESSPAGMQVSLDLNSPPLGVCGGRMHIWLQRWQGSPAQTLVAQILQALTQGPRAWLITPLDPQGFPYLSRLFAPIGLEIHAETPAEIAISITAQLIQVRRGSPKRMPGETQGVGLPVSRRTS